jgi:hypothetical protein
MARFVMGGTEAMNLRHEVFGAMMQEGGVIGVAMP